MRNSSSRGSALLLAVLLCALLGGLAFALLHAADTSELVAAHAGRREALINVAETGAAAVKAWFDRPASGDPSFPPGPRHLFLGVFDLRDASSFQVSQRLIDLDGLSSTPPVAADGSPGREYHRQGVPLFTKPFVGGSLRSFLGTRHGPDLIQSDQSGVDMLDQINDFLFTDQRRGRIDRIVIRGVRSVDPALPREGIATIEITASRYRRLVVSGGVPVVPPGERPLHSVVARIRLGELPLTLPRGPLEACGGMQLLGPLRVRWGRITAVGDLRLPPSVGEIDTFVPSSWPYSSLTTRINHSPPGDDLGIWLSHSDPVEDPWLKILAGGVFPGWSALPDQPFLFNPSTAPGLDHSNLFQRVPGLVCPSFDYAFWKEVATRPSPGDRYLHYFVFDPTTGGFRRQGTGASRSVRDWTHGRSGLFFFDTTDSQPPDGSNLTPPVIITGGDWSSAGMIYLNARSFQATDVAGTERVLLPPGEPFDDIDGNLHHSATEWHLNLAYPATETGVFQPDPLAIGNGAAVSPDGEAYRVNTTTGRDETAIPFLTEVNLFGVLFNAGDILAEGNATHYGSLVAGGDVTQNTTGLATPRIYFDERLNTGTWPPPEIAIPRTYVASWRIVAD